MAKPDLETCQRYRDKFWDTVNVGDPNECWPFKNRLDPKGYGRFGTDGRASLAHVIAYKLAYGEYPDKYHDGRWLTIDHLCENNRCCNFLHLEVTTVGENTRRGKRNASSINREKTHCPLGHKLTEGNIYVVEGKWRRCKTCSRRQRSENHQRTKIKYKQSAETVVIARTKRGDSVQK